MSGLRQLFNKYRQLSIASIRRINAGRLGGVKMADAGTTDWLGPVKSGRAFAMEVKDIGECVKMLLFANGSVNEMAMRAASRKAKASGKSDPYAQYWFLQDWANMGGYACVVHSVGEAIEHIHAATQGVKSPGPKQWASKGSEPE